MFRYKIIIRGLVPRTAPNFIGNTVLKTGTLIIRLVLTQLLLVLEMSNEMVKDNVNVQGPQE